MQWCNSRRHLLEPKHPPPQPLLPVSSPTENQDGKWKSFVVKASPGGMHLLRNDAWRSSCIHATRVGGGGAGGGRMEGLKHVKY